MAERNAIVIASGGHSWATLGEPNEKTGEPTYHAHHAGPGERVEIPEEEFARGVALGTLVDSDSHDAHAADLAHKREAYDAARRAFKAAEAELNEAEGRSAEQMRSLLGRAQRRPRERAAEVPEGEVRVQTSEPPQDAPAPATPEEEAPPARRGPGRPRKHS